MEPAVRVAPTPTRPGVDERLPRADHLPRSDEAIIPEQLPGVELLAAGACINPCHERTNVFGKFLPFQLFWFWCCFYLNIPSDYYFLFSKIFYPPFSVEYGSFPRVPIGLFCCGRGHQYPPAQVVPTSTSSLSPRPLQSVDPALIARSFALPLIQSMYQISAVRPPLLRQDALRPSTPEVQVVPPNDLDVQADEDDRVISPRPSTSAAAANDSLSLW